MYRGGRRNFGSRGFGSSSHGGRGGRGGGGRGRGRQGGGRYNANRNRHHNNNNRESPSQAAHNIGSTGKPTSSSFTVAVQGCSHGELDSIYDSLEAYRVQNLNNNNTSSSSSSSSFNNKAIDVLLCCGDVQTLRNTGDFHSLNVPPKYKAMGDFHAYYSGQKIAPILTIMIGGNHESSNYLQELHYGGWVAPNIYYLGAAGVVNLCKRNISTNTISSIRIAGLSGIYNSRHYSLGRFEAPPYDQGTLRSVYHTREVDVKRLQGLATAAALPSSSSSPSPATEIEQQQTMDIIISHDWPRGIAYHGDLPQLLRKKPFFKQEIEDNELGSPGNEILLNTLKPKYWFAAHLHVKFEALVRHNEEKKSSDIGKGTEQKQTQQNEEATMKAAGGKTEEITTTEPETKEASPKSSDITEFIGLESNDGTCPVSSNIESLTEQMTRFLSLDKCLPRRRHIQITHLEPSSTRDVSNGIELTSNNTWLEYDASWLAVLRRTKKWTQRTSRRVVLTEGIDPITKEEKEDIGKRFEGDDDSDTAPLVIPQNFVMTVPPHDPSFGNRIYGPPPQMVGNPQTDQLLETLELEHCITVPYTDTTQQQQQQQPAFFQRQPPPQQSIQQQLIPSVVMHSAARVNNVPSRTTVGDNNEIDIDDDVDENEIDLEEDDTKGVKVNTNDASEIDLDEIDEECGDAVCWGGNTSKKPRVED